MDQNLIKSFHRGRANRKKFGIALAVTLAIYASALIWPELVLQPFGTFIGTFSVREELARQPQISAEMAPASPEKPSAETVDVQGISFAIDPVEIAKAQDEEAAATASTTLAAAKPDGNVQTAASRNHLKIPRMGVDADVIHSDSDKALWRGLWHIPGSALPGEPGNIVISAHRWLYKPPNPKTFYLIDTMQVGDPIYYEYGQKRYEYKVTKTFVVNPEDVEILKQDESKLTLFTCTPLYSTKQRFVVTAELVNVELIT